MGKTGSINVDKFGYYQLFGNKLYVNGKDFYAQFGIKGHNGVDSRQKEGNHVYSETNGTVVASYSAAQGGTAGSYIVVRTTIRRDQWRYLHLSKRSVKVGQRVKRGQLLGLAGKTGASNGVVHLHFDWKPRNADLMNGYHGYEDPLKFLKKYADG